MVITKNKRPRILNVWASPKRGINNSAANGPKMAELALKAATAMPKASPRLSGNHFARTEMMTVQPSPVPNPTITPKYKTSAESVRAYEERKKPELARIPPEKAQKEGPHLS